MTRFKIGDMVETKLGVGYVADWVERDGWNLPVNLINGEYVVVCENDCKPSNKPDPLLE